MIKSSIIAIIFLFLTSCSQKKDIANEPYTFFVAGHTYGTPGTGLKGIFPPFLNKFGFIDSIELLLFGVLTGDIVKNGNLDEWEAVENDLSLINKPIHYALGNHDYKNLDVINKKFDKTYYDFKINDDLHIILDPNIDRWNISGDQLQYLKETLENNKNNVDNIFVYVHQLIWWKHEKPYGDIRINSFEGKDKNNNFWDVIAPLFYEINKPVYFFAGDIGAANWSDDYSYHLDHNIRLISSGMGENSGDNFLIVNILKDNNIRIELHPLDNEGIIILEN